MSKGARKALKAKKLAVRSQSPNACRRVRYAGMGKGSKEIARPRRTVAAPVESGRDTSEVGYSDFVSIFHPTFGRMTVERGGYDDRMYGDASGYQRSVGGSASVGSEYEYRY